MEETCEKWMGKLIMLAMMAGPVIGAFLSLGAWPRATDDGDKDGPAHHCGAGVAGWGSHREAGIGGMPPIPYCQNLLFSVAHGRRRTARGTGPCAHTRAGGRGMAQDRSLTATHSALAQASS